jgi:hypothetical protein
MAATLTGGVAAAIAWLTARTVFPEALAGTVPFIAAWIALYPVSRWRSTPMTGWHYWLIGALIAIVGGAMRTLLR